MYHTDVDPIFYELSKLDSSICRIDNRKSKAKGYLKETIRQIKEFLNQLQLEERLDCFRIGFLSLDCDNHPIFPDRVHIREMAIKIRSILNECMFNILTDRDCYTKPNEVKRELLEEYAFIHITHGIVTSMVKSQVGDQIALRPLLHMRVRTCEDMYGILDDKEFEKAFVETVNEQLEYAMEYVRLNARRAIILDLTETLIADSNFEGKLAKIREIVY